MDIKLNNIISFSLAEDTEESREGAIENAKLVKDTFPNWQANFYLPQNTSESTASAISEQENCNVLLVSDDVKVKPCFWRYIPLVENQSVSSVVFRDVNNRINKFDFDMVNEWNNSAYQFHSIKNFDEKGSDIIYPYHWGLKIHGPINTQWLYHYLTKEELFNNIEDYHEDMMLFSFHRGFNFLFAEHILSNQELTENNKND